MANEKSKNTHTDCSGSGCAVEEVDNVLKMKMEGKRQQRPREIHTVRLQLIRTKARRATGFKRTKVEARALALKRSTALKRAKDEARALCG